MFEPVPLYVDQASHAAATLRTSPYAAFGGREGIIRERDCKVVEGGTPGGFVNIHTGVLSILGRGPAQDGQMYVALSRTQTQLDINPTDSSGSRSDLIIVNVEDPYDGTGQWSELPEDERDHGPYVFPRVIQGVPSGTTDVHDLADSIGVRNAVTLARVDIPPSTATITNDLVTDLRQMSNPMFQMKQYFLNHPASVQSWKETSLTDMPSGANLTIRVPMGATLMDVNVTCKPMRLYAPNGGTDNELFGRCAVALNGTPGTPAYYNRTWRGAYSELWTGVADTYVVEHLQGQDITLQVMHSADGGLGGPEMEIQSYDWTTTVFVVSFNQQPI